MARGHGSASGSRVFPIDLASRTPGVPISIGGRVTALAVTPDGTKLYAARRGAIAAVDAATGAVTAAIAVGAAAPRALATSPDGRRLAALSGSRLVLADLQR